jgi:hypothetical protein
MTSRTYLTPEAFRQALEQRLRAAAKTQRDDITRLRQVLVFDRFLTRIFDEFGDRAVAKGGVALELRLDRARTTRDVDLRMIGPGTNLLAHLRRAGTRKLGDHLTFEVVPDRYHPRLDGDGLVYEGQRFRVEAALAGKIYGSSFGLDVGFGDVMTEPPEVIDGSDFLAFAGVVRPRHRVYSRESHIAEKLHAYTMPRARINSRVKDLPDLALLATTGPFDSARLRTALDATFVFRKTHSLPSQIPAPPESWAATYMRMANDDALPWQRIDALFDAVRGFLDPILVHPQGIWDPERWIWS